MYEVELKVRADHDRLRGALADHAAAKLGQVLQVDTYYDAPHCDFAETDEALRIRRETPRSAERSAETTTKLTYKGPLIEAASKSRKEHETVVADGEAMAKVLSGLGFEPAATVEKERQRYRLDGWTLTLDTIEELGEFLEVERDVDTAPEVEAVREEATTLLRKLDLDPADQIRTSYLGLLLEQGTADQR